MVRSTRFFGRGVMVSPTQWARRASMYEENAWFSLSGLHGIWCASSFVSVNSPTTVNLEREHLVAYCAVAGCQHGRVRIHWFIWLLWLTRLSMVPQLGISLPLFAINGVFVSGIHAFSQQFRSTKQVHQERHLLINVLRNVGRA